MLTSERKKLANFEVRKQNNIVTSEAATGGVL